MKKPVTPARRVVVSSKEVWAIEPREADG